VVCPRRGGGGSAGRWAGPASRVRARTVRPRCAARLHGVAAEESARTAQAVRGREASRAPALRPTRSRTPASARRADLERCRIGRQSMRQSPSPPAAECFPRWSSGGDAKYASRPLSRGMASLFTPQKRCGRPLGKSRPRFVLIEKTACLLGFSPRLVPAQSRTERDEYGSRRGKCVEFDPASFVVSHCQSAEGDGG